MKALKIIIVTVSFLVHFAISMAQESKCTQIKDLPPCVCSMDGKNIDLRSLANKDTP